MVYMFLADGFEEIEALCPLDILRRAGIEVTTVGIGRKNIIGAHSIEVVADITDSDFVCDGLEMVILPGGMPGTLNLEGSNTCKTAIEYAYKNEKYIAAICAAPSIIGKMGILQGKNAVCFPGFEGELKGADVKDIGVCTDGKIITAAGMGVAFEFGLRLVEVLRSKEAADRIYYSTQAHRNS